MDESGKDGTIRIVVETVRVEGGGALLLTGPSSCGKGEIAKELCRFLSIPRSMRIDYLKTELGPQKVALIDAHQPVFNGDGNLDLEQSVRAVTLSVIQALGLPQFLLDIR